MAQPGFDPITGVHAVIESSAGVIDASLHADAEAICPRCLSWIESWDFVRRNSFDLLQHESCPPRP